MLAPFLMLLLLDTRAPAQPAAEAPSASASSPALDAARKLYRAGDLRNALTRLGQLRKDPSLSLEDKVELHWYLGATLHAMGRTKESRAELDALVALRPLYAPDTREAPPDLRALLEERRAAYRKSAGLVAGAVALEGRVLTLTLEGKDLSTAAVFVRALGFPAFQRLDVPVEHGRLRAELTDAALWKALRRKGTLEAVVEVLDSRGLAQLRVGEVDAPVQLPVTPQQAQAVLDTLPQEARSTVDTAVAQANARPETGLRRVLAAPYGFAVAGAVGSAVALVAVLPCIWLSFGGPFTPALMVITWVWAGLLGSVAGGVAWLVGALWSPRRTGLVPQVLLNGLLSVAGSCAGTCGALLCTAPCLLPAGTLSLLLTAGDVAANPRNAGSLSFWGRRVTGEVAGAWGLMGVLGFPCWAGGLLLGAASAPLLGAALARWRSVESADRTFHLDLLTPEEAPAAPAPAPAPEALESGSRTSG